MDKSSREEVNEEKQNQENYFSKAVEANRPFLLYCLKFMVAIIFVPIVLFIGYNVLNQSSFKNDGFWTNYWVIIAAVLTTLGAISGIFLQLQADNFYKKHTKFIELQDTIVKDMSPDLVDYISNQNGRIITEKDEDFVNLVKNLVKVLYNRIDLDKQRSLLNIGEEDHSISDTQEFDNVLENILQNKNNVMIINYIKDHYKDLKGFIERRDGTNTSVSDENNSALNDSDNENKVFDRKIKGFWILNKYSAQQAKYLIGVSTKSKRILGIYKLANNENPEENIDFDSNTNRIFFKGTNIYRKSSKSEGVLPGLEEWTAQNPILYYKQYLNYKKKWNNLKEENGFNQLVNLITDSEEKNEFKEVLNDNDLRDIIVVRTPKFD